jgi:hypothetical protein
MILYWLLLNLLENLDALQKLKNITRWVDKNMKKKSLHINDLFNLFLPVLSLHFIWKKKT